MPSELQGHRATATSPRVLLTGGSGVVGQGLIRHWPGARFVVLTRLRDAGAADAVHGDVRTPGLGLGPRAFAELAGRVDCVVHAAACTRFDASPDDYQHVNVDGTRHVLEFAAAAGARMVHVSTAFVHQGLGGGSAGSMGYRESKIAAEAEVRASGLDAMIVRPSVVVGDAGTGEITDFQGLYQVAAALERGLVPVAPVDPDGVVDVVPRDYVSAAIRAVLEHDLGERHVWVTAGERAPSIAQVMGWMLATCVVDGTVPPPKFVDRTVYDRLYEPVFMPALPARMRGTVQRLLAFLEGYLTLREPLPSSAPLLEEFGVSNRAPADLVLERSLEFWQRERGGGRARRAGAPSAGGRAG